MAPRRISTVEEMLSVFERHLVDREQEPPRLSFLVKGWEGMDGEFVARLVGDSESSPRFTRNLKIYTPDGTLYCFANVSTQVCKEPQWILDGRPVFFKVKTFGTFIGSTVNPRNGHLSSCSCGVCAADRGGLEVAAAI